MFKRVIGAIAAFVLAIGLGATFAPAATAVTPTGASAWYVPDPDGRHKTCFGVDRYYGGSTYDAILCPGQVTYNSPINWPATAGAWIGAQYCVEYLDKNNNSFAFRMGPTYQRFTQNVIYRMRAFPCSYAKKTAVTYEDAPTQTSAAVTVANWPLVQSTRYKDISGNGLGLTLDPVYNGVTQSVYGTTFNGHGRLNLAPTAKLSPGSANISITGEIRTKDLYGNFLNIGNTDVVGGAPLFKIEVSGNRGDGFGGALRCRVTGSTGSALLVSPAPISDGAWHDFECRKEAQGFFMLIDGVVVQSQPNVVIGSIDLSNNPVAIGAKNGTFDAGDALGPEPAGSPPGNLKHIKVLIG